MKKITALFFLLLFAIIFFYQNDGKETKTVAASIEKQDNYQKLYLKFEDDILTTKNFKIYFNSNMHIISLFTKFNYCKTNNIRYLFKFPNIDDNLKDYYNNYINQSSKTAKNYFQGVPIYIVEIDLNSREFHKIMAKNKNIMYSDELCGNYQR